MGYALGAQTNKVIASKEYVDSNMPSQGVYVTTNDLHAALVDFDKTLELDESLAEAWYNRGLVLVLLNRMDEAFSDLSRAGELGIYSAYNIIKRFSKGD